ncbi:uncharacterized protein ACHE_50528S [Aspergillus chevalieri]|uniref:Uncharacterized protein n=1 Tax=Aspergillus chevalieri TaxID=182096 RepID=A0A7R7ZNX7_ASPCH|nr:uncharacterized protein ACHE_50528S [Aspergillus chevalieri]BCR89330.1 hypothetical protein ACHE_50528S [Aspergillus chevalieri]
MRFSTVIPSALVGLASLSAAAPTKNIPSEGAVADVTDVPEAANVDNINKRAEDAANDEQKNQDDDYFVNPASPAGQPQPGFGQSGYNAGAAVPGFRGAGYAPRPDYASHPPPYGGFAKRDENSGEYFVNPKQGQPGYGRPQGYGRPGYAPGTAPYPEYAPGTAPYPEVTKRDENSGEYFTNPHYSQGGYGRPGYAPGTAPYPEYAPGTAPYPEVTKRDENSGEYFVNPNHGQAGYGRPQGYGRPGYAPGTAPYPEYAPGTAPYPEVTKRDENAGDYFVPGPAAPATGYNGPGYGHQGFAPGSAPYPEYPGAGRYPGFAKRSNDALAGEDHDGNWIIRPYLEPEHDPLYVTVNHVGKRDENANDYFVPGPAAPATGYNGPNYGRPGFAPGTAPYPEYPGVGRGFAKRDENAGESFAPGPAGPTAGYNGQGYGRQPNYAPGTAPYPEYAPGTAPYPEVTKRDENANEANNYFVPGPAAPATGYNGPNSGYGASGFGGPGYGNAALPSAAGTPWYA